TTAAHEMGHGLGVGHVDDQYSLMYPHLRGGQSRRSLTSHDIAAITQIYS
ncbi:MAG: matrixin family metalloprotease, partial [Puniceicoccales bacterium]